MEKMIRQPLTGQRDMLATNQQARILHMLSIMITVEKILLFSSSSMTEFLQEAIELTRWQRVGLMLELLVDATGYLETYAAFSLEKTCLTSFKSQLKKFQDNRLWETQLLARTCLLELFRPLYQTRSLLWQSLQLTQRWQWTSLTLWMIFEWTQLLSNRQRPLLLIHQY